MAVQHAVALLEASNRSGSDAACSGGLFELVQPLMRGLVLAPGPPAEGANVAGNLVEAIRAPAS